MASIRPSYERAWALRSECFSLEKTCSIGFRSGEYLGRKSSLAPAARIASDPLSAVAAEIVHDHHVASLQRRDREGPYIGQEGLAVDRPVEQTGRVDAVAPQGGDKGHGLPAAERRLGLQALATRAPPSQWRHVGLRPGLINQHQAARIDAILIFPPLLTPPRDVGTILLLGEQAFF